MASPASPTPGMQRLSCAKAEAEAEIDAAETPRGISAIGFTSARAELDAGHHDDEYGEGKDADAEYEGFDCDGGELKDVEGGLAGCSGTGMAALGFPPLAAELLPRRAETLPLAVDEVVPCVLGQKSTHSVARALTSERARR